MGDAQLGIIVKATDQATATLKRIESSVSSIDRGMGALHNTLGKLSRGFASFNAVLQGLGIGVGIGSFYALQRAIGSLIRLLPDLIGRGVQWAATVDNISDVTGLAANQASALAGAANDVNVSSDTLTTGLTRLARNVVDNEQSFTKLGIATRDANGQMLGVWDIFNNVRRAISDTGNSAQSTAAMIKLLGRGGAELADLMTLPDAAFNQLIADAQKSGLIMSDAASKAAEAWERTKARMQGAITGIGVQIMGGVAPYLSRLTDGITNVIQANMANIVRFAVQVVNFIAGLVSGLFGLQIPTVTLAEQVQNAATGVNGINKGLGDTPSKTKKAAQSEDELTKSLNKQIDAIDRKIQALDREGQRENAAEQRQQIIQDITAAKAQLADLQDQSIFAAGMSEAERVLAEQKHAQDIINASKDVADAQQRLRDHDAEQARQEQRNRLEDERKALQDRLAAHRKAAADTAKAWNGAIDGIRQHFTDAFNPKTLSTDIGAGLSAAVTQAATQAAAAGKSFAESIRRFLFGGTTGGQNRRVPNPDGKGSSVITIGGTHTEGLFEKIDGLITTLKNFWDTTLKPIWDAMNQLTQPLKDLLGPQGFATLFVLWKTGVIPPIAALVTRIGALLVALGSRLFNPGNPSAPASPGGRGAPAEPTGEPPLTRSAPGTNPLGLLAAELGIPAAILAGTAIPFIPQFTNPGATNPGRTVANNPAAQNFYNPNSPVLPDGSPNPAYRGNLPGRDTDRQSFYTPNINAYTGFNLGQTSSPLPWQQAVQKSLQITADAVTPGGSFFQQIYNAASSQSNTEDSASRTADAAEATKNTSQTTAQNATDQTGINRSLLSQIQSGINTSVVNNPVISSIQAKLGLDPTTTVGVNNRPQVDVGTPGVSVTNNPTVQGVLNKIAIQNGATVDLDGVNTPNGAVSIVTTSGNTLDLPSNVEKNIANTTNNTNLLSNLKAKNGALNTITKSGSGGSTYGGCFPYETPVATPSGDRPIGELVAGDVIYAVDMVTMQRVETTIEYPIPHPEHTEQRLLVTLANGTEIETTACHRFYDVAQDLYHRIDEFEVGTVVLDYSTGRPVEVPIAAMVDLGDDPKDVYNIEVAVHHNYLVAGVLVHNPKANAQGAAGIVSSTTEVGVIGEAGREAYAILRMPRHIGHRDLGGFGGPSASADSTPIEIVMKVNESVLGRVVTNWQAMRRTSTTMRLSRAGGSS